MSSELGQKRPSSSQNFVVDDCWYCYCCRCLFVDVVVVVDVIVVELVLTDLLKIPELLMILDDDVDGVVDFFLPEASFASQLKLH